jgi:hypothetical protein
MHPHKTKSSFLSVPESMEKDTLDFAVGILCRNINSFEKAFEPSSLAAF